MKTLALLVALGTLSWNVNADSCSGRCNSALDSTKACQCNSQCIRFGDCCVDYYLLCVESDSCSNRCGDNVDSSKNCQCNPYCMTYEDCCPDYDLQCNGGSGGNPSTIGSPASSDISAIANLIWAKDVNKASSSYYTLDYQAQVADGGNTDHAHRPLFKSLQESQILSKVTYQRFISLLNNYDPNTGNTEHISSSQWAEVDHFLDSILATPLMRDTETFLRNNGKVSGGSSAFKETLHKVWFELYRRTSSGPISSSGFEHVFVGETASSKVSGFHSWIQFYLEEQSGRLDYKGYVSKSEPNLIGSQFSWHDGKWKAKGTFFVGTSPEFDIAIYTICFLMKPNAECKFNINNHNVVIQTYDNANWTGQQIATAYPK